MILNQPIHLWLEKNGITGHRVTRFISDIMPLLVATSCPDPKVVAGRMDRIGWKGLNLDETTLVMIRNGFEQAGLMGASTPVPIADAKGLGQLLEKIYRERGVDFRGYAKTSLARRVKRRMDAQKISYYTEYMDFLDQNPDEYAPLFDDLTVTVTRFFRNSSAFEAFKQAIQTIMATKEDKQLNVWSAGCATGQEPFSIAILLDQMTRNIPGWTIRILATDIDTKALNLAKTGLFPLEAIKDVPKDIIKTYFKPEQDSFKVCSKIRNMVAFKPHNMISDPSMTHQDIIVCRNVLIYFNLALQMRVVSKFHKVINNRGYLLLGRYEMLLKQARRQFSCVDFEARLYRRKK